MNNFTRLTLLLFLASCSDGGSPDGAGSDMAVDDMSPLDLAVSDSSQGDLSMDLSMPDASPDAGVPHLPLSSQQWELANDEGLSRTLSPMVALTALDDTSASVSAQGFDSDGGPCTCNAQHAVFALANTFDCATATVEFDYTTSGSFGATNTTSVLLKFTIPAGQAGYLSVSEQSGSSSCAINLAGDSFPSPPKLVEGHNSFKLSTLMSGTDGVCAGTFDRLDVSLEAFACTAADTSTATIANVNVF